jgi:transcriptional regulator with XRE-family HTH domain
MKVRSIGTLGDYLREQRRNAELSLRQLADLAGVSNPYLSQIERGVRRPSAEVLQQLAKALRVSAEVLYVRAGLLDPSEGEEREDISVEMAIHADPNLSVRQKRVLLDIYSSFRREADEEETSEPERESTTQNRAVRHARQED